METGHFVVAESAKWNASMLHANASESGLPLACFASNEPATVKELRSLMHCALPEELLGLWNVVRSPRLFVDTKYGQWGLTILSPQECVARTAEFRLWRQEYRKPGDLIVGCFLGDSDLLLCRCDEKASDFGSIHVVLPIDPRVDWPMVAPNLHAFFQTYFVNKGEKFWERRAGAAPPHAN